MVVGIFAPSATALTPLMTQADARRQHPVHSGWRKAGRYQPVETTAVGLPEIDQTKFFGVICPLDHRGWL